MEKTINKKNVKPGDLVRIVLPEGTKLGDFIGGYTMTESMFNANNSIVKVQDVDECDVRVEIKDNQDLGLFWFNKSCIQPLLEDDVPQFKVGDTVIITIPDSYKYCKVPFGIVPDMLPLNGMCTKIQNVCENQYDKKHFSHIENLDGCAYNLEAINWTWPNCFLIKVEDFDYLTKPYQETINKLTSVSTRDTCTTISNPIKEDKGLIKVKSKKLKLNFKN